MLLNITSSTVLRVNFGDITTRYVRINEEQRFLLRVIFVSNFVRKFIHEI